jgi:hypothetical protein
MVSVDLLRAWQRQREIAREKARLDAIRRVTEAIRVMRVT